MSGVRQSEKLSRIYCRSNIFLTYLLLLFVKNGHPARLKKYHLIGIFQIVQTITLFRTSPGFCQKAIYNASYHILHRHEKQHILQYPTLWDYKV